MAKFLRCKNKAELEITANDETMHCIEQKIAKTILARFLSCNTPKLQIMIIIAQIIPKLCLNNTISGILFCNIGIKEAGYRAKELTK